MRTWFNCYIIDINFQRVYIKPHKVRNDIKVRKCNISVRMVIPYDARTPTMFLAIT